MVKVRTAGQHSFSVVYTFPPPIVLSILWSMGKLTIFKILPAFEPYTICWKSMEVLPVGLKVMTRDSCVTRKILLGVICSSSKHNVGLSESEFTILFDIAFRIEQWFLDLYSHRVGFVLEESAQNYFDTVWMTFLNKQFLSGNNRRTCETLLSIVIYPVWTMLTAIPKGSGTHCPKSFPLNNLKQKRSFFGMSRRWLWWASSLKIFPRFLVWTQTLNSGLRWLQPVDVFSSSVLTA